MALVLTFSGYSDDTFDCSPGPDYDNCASGKPIIFRVAAGDESVLVWGQYPLNLDVPGGGWLVGVMNDEADLEEKPIPAWPMRLQAGATPYSPTLVIEAPDGAVVTRAHPGA